MNVQVKANWQGKPLDVLARAIELRRQELGETTPAVVVATSINVLKSLRSETKKVNPEKASGFVTCAARDDLVAGWENGGAGRVGKRCVRYPGRAGKVAIPSNRVVNLAGRYVRGENPKVYIGIDARGEGKDDRQERVWIIANDAEYAREFVRQRRLRRIRRYARMAAWLIGRAMYAIARKQYGADENIFGGARRVATNNLKTAVVKARDFAVVKFADKLNYSVAALKQGEASFVLAVKRAANFTVSQVTRKTIDFGRRYETPFPEASRS